MTQMHTLFPMVRTPESNVIDADYLLVLDPTLKLEYLDVAWDQEFIKTGMNCMKKRVSN